MCDRFPCVFYIAKLLQFKLKFQTYIFNYRALSYILCHNYYVIFKQLSLDSAENRESFNEKHDFEIDIAEWY